MKPKYLILLLAAAMLVPGMTTISLAAAKAKAKPKAKTTKPQTTKPKLGSIGTTQLPGDWCEFGKAYTLGKADPLNVTLKSAEYTIGHVKVGNRTFRAEEGEKLLVIRYSLHNPVSREQRVNSSSITWTAVDSKDKNRNQEYQGVGVEDKALSKLDTSMKPAQKIQAFAVIRVDANGEVPKLMAARYQVPAPVARYNLKGKVKPLPAPYADPNDKTGATVAKEIPGVMGTFYTTGDWDAKVEKIEYATPPFADEGYNEGDVYVLVTLECKNFGESEAGFGGSYDPTYGAELKDADGVTYKRTYGYITASSTRLFSPRAKPGESARFRIVFSVPKGVELKTLTLKEYSGYPVVIDLTGQKTPSD